MTSRRLVLVTGASGFVGCALCPALRAAGWRVRAALRSAGASLARESIDEQALVGELGPRTDWAAALEGVDAVVHLAGLAHVAGDAAAAQVAAYRTINTEATAALARAAAARGVRRFVFMSSARVHGEASPGRAWTEADAPQPPDAYARSKWEAERALAAVCAGGAMQGVILRPPLVYGPGVRANFLRMMAWVARGVPLPLAALRNRRSLVYVGNLAAAIAACLDHPAAAGRTFLVSDGEAVSSPELIRRIAQALGRRSRLFAVPVPLLRAGAALLARREDFVRLAGDFVLDDRALRAALGWHPPVSMQEGLQATARWFLSLSRTDRSR